MGPRMQVLPAERSDRTVKQKHWPDDGSPGTNSDGPVVRRVASSLWLHLDLDAERGHLGLPSLVQALMHIDTETSHRLLNVRLLVLSNRAR